MKEETKIWSLRYGLSPGLKGEIRYRDKHTNMKDFIELLKKADIRMEAYQEENHHRPRAPLAAPPHPQPVPRPPPPAVSSPPTSGGMTPLDLSAGRRQVSQQERDARMREGRWFYGGGIGHLSSSCPATRRTGLGARPAFRISAMEAAAAAATSEDLIDFRTPPPIVPPRPGAPAGNTESLI